MKVLRIIPSMNPNSGGPCQGIRNSIPEMHKMGIVNDVVCLDDVGSPFLGMDSFKIITLGKAKYSWRYNENLYSWLLANLTNYDIVVIHGLWLYHSFATHKAIKELKSTGKIVPKHYVMPHGMLDPYFQRASGRKIKAIRNWIYWKLIEQYVVNNAVGVLFTCEQELLLARDAFRPYNPKKELNIGYGIASPPVFNEGQRIAFSKLSNSTITQPYILFLSRIHEKKGVDILIEAYENVFVENSNIPVLVIAGPGLDSSYGKSLVNKVKTSKILASKIFFTGMLTGDAKWGAINGCEAFILPSHQENFGIAVVEALACSKPVLITNKINIWREIEMASAGIIKNDTVDGIKELLTSYLNITDDKRTKLKINARLAFEKYFEITNAARNLISVLQANFLSN